MSRKILIILVIVVAIAVPVGIYTISPLFIMATVNEPLQVITTVQREKTLSGIFMGVADGFHKAEGIVK